MSPALLESLRAWRDSATGRTWPDSCGLSTEPLEGDGYDRAVDLVMSAPRGGAYVVPRHHLYEVLSRALATIHELREVQ